jgi:HAD superfamily hydrolase (TIGR01509 family)
LTRAVELEAVLFDLDGVLVDSEPLWSVVEEEVTGWLGGSWGPQVKAALLGKPLEAASAELLRVTGNERASVSEVGRRLTDGLVERFESELEVLPGAVALLDALAADGVPLAVVSSSSRQLVDAALAVVGAHRFGVTVAGDEHDAHKPDPGPYLEAASRLRVDPRRCVAIEDSPTGIASAESAGCVVVAVPNVVSVDRGEGRHVVDSLGAVSPEWLRSLLSA